jgi:CubicO group peptidase (beta-lactamase class C family)
MSKVVLRCILGRCRIRNESMTTKLRFNFCLLLLPLFAGCASPKLPGVGAAMQAAVDTHEISGAVTVVVTKNKVIHLETTGLADIANQRPMQPDTLFWIASMTKPITAVSVLMLQDEGKLNVADTNGVHRAQTLADLIPLYLATPMQYEPGAKWKYTQSGINTAARIVEIVSGRSFDAFVQQRILDPLRMKYTTFYPANKRSAHLVVAYRKDNATGELTVAPPHTDFGVVGHPPFGNGGLYSTGPDYARFCQMLLGGGVYHGKRYLSPAAMNLLTTVQTGDLPTGFFQSAEYGQYGGNYGWGIGTCILRNPHPGVAAMLSPGTFGHGGAWGTQAWMDPVRGVAYILMVQRSDLGNSDATAIRRAFQQAAADTLAQKAAAPTTE